MPFDMLSLPRATSLKWYPCAGFDTLSSPAQDAVRRRLFRCGLAATLDHALRLQYSAQDSQQHTAFANDPADVSNACLIILEERVASLSPPSGCIHCGSTTQGAGGSSGGAAGTGSSNDEAPGPQLGLLLTLSKRAAMLTRALEAVRSGAAAGGVEGGGGRGQQGGLPDRQWVMSWAAEVLTMLRRAAKGIEAAVRDRLEGAGREAAAAAVGGASGVGHGGGAGDEVWREDAVCVDEVQEALALAARAASNLAAPLGWELAVDLGTAAGAGAAAEMPAVQASVTRERGTRMVSDVLLCMTGWWRGPLLPPAQLLACQPQRLLAAACALAAALPEHTVVGRQKRLLCVLVPSLVALMSSHKTLSGRVRGWLLASPPLAAASGPRGGNGSGGGPELDACAGCLYEPISSIALHTLPISPCCSAHTAALLVLAKGEIQPKSGVPCCSGGHDATGEPDGGFREFAAAVAERMRQRNEDPSIGEVFDVPLPDGTSPVHELISGVACTGMEPPPPPSPPPGPLPPPLALPPSRAGALPRLRMCGNPRCDNFAGECEGALPLKQCGGCRAVRYCGADCQRSHWREGHRAECKALAE